jgi:hypothetical protein
LKFSDGLKLYLENEEWLGTEIQSYGKLFLTVFRLVAVGGIGYYMTSEENTV